MGVHAAGTQHGLAYHLAPLQGTRARILTALLSRAPAQHVAFAPLQQLIWQIEGGLSYDEMPQQSQQLVVQLVPEYRSQLRADFVKELQKKVDTSGVILGRLGVRINTQAIDALLQRYRTAQQTLMQYANNYEALAQHLVNVIPGTAPNAGPTSWSRLNPRVYARIIGGNVYGERANLEVRVLPSASVGAAAAEPDSGFERVSYDVEGSPPPSEQSASDLAPVPLGPIIAYPVNAYMQGLGFGVESPPTVQLSAPTINGTTVSVNGTAQPTTPGASITQLAWNWGDGTPVQFGLFPETHTYAQALNYTVTVTATDSNNLTGSAQESLQLLALATPPNSCSESYSSPYPTGSLKLGGIPIQEPPGILSLVIIPEFGSGSFGSEANFRVGVMVQDCLGNPMAAVSVKLHATSGQLGRAQVKTGRNGMTTTTLTLAATSTPIQNASTSHTLAAIGYTKLSFSTATVTASVDSGVDSSGSVPLATSATVSAGSETLAVPTPGGPIPGPIPASWQGALNAPISFSVAYAHGVPQPNNPQAPLEFLCNKVIPAASLVTTAVGCLGVGAAFASCPVIGVTCPVDAALIPDAVGCATGLLGLIGVQTAPTATHKADLLQLGAQTLCEARNPSQIAITGIAAVPPESQTVLVQTFNKDCNSLQAYVFLIFSGNGQASACTPSCSNGTGLSDAPQLFAIPAAGLQVQYSVPSSGQSGSDTLIASLAANETTATHGTASYSFASPTIWPLCPLGTTSSGTTQLGIPTMRPPAIAPQPAPSSKTNVVPIPHAPSRLKLSISGISPGQGPAGAWVTISGTGFNNVIAVTFGGTTATFTRISQTTIQATVPDVSYADSTIKTLGPRSQVGVTVTVKTASGSANSVFNYTGPQ